MCTLHVRRGRERAQCPDESVTETLTGGAGAECAGAAGVTGKCSDADVVGGVRDRSAAAACWGGAVTVAVGAAVTRDAERARVTRACVSLTSSLANALTILSSSFGEMPLISSTGGRPISSRSSNMSES